MANKENKMFTGFSKVFNFTASQNIKGKGFKVSTILLGLFIAAGFALISILMAVSQKDDSDSGNDINDIIPIEEEVKISEVYYVNNSALDDSYIEGITSLDAFDEMKFNKVDVNDKAATDTNNYLSGKASSIVMELIEDEKEISIKYYIPYGSDLSDDDIDVFGDSFGKYVEYLKINEMAKLDESFMKLYNASVHTNAILAGEDVSDFGVMFAKILVPMLFSLILYMMILLYGQNITKIVVSEKSSKLMETLLTSVKPYAIISGKILAVSGIAIFQMLIWIFAAIGGYIAGEQIAESINPGYINYVSLVIDMISNSSDAFSIGSIILSIVILIIGFLMFCVIAGLVAAMVDKMEDISTAMSLFQIPVIIGFFGAYFVPMSEDKSLLALVRYIPVTSPFCVPADIMVGNMSVIEGIGSLAILGATTFVLILLTGKIYKGKLFNRS